MPINQDRLLDLLSSMVNIYSPTGKETEIVHFVEGYLKKAGFSPILQTVEKDRHNIVIIDEKKSPALCMAGHLDTVPAMDYDNYSFYREGNELTGLGTSDMKSGCAAMIEAFHTFYEETGRFPDAALALLVGEEETGDGAVKFLEDFGFSWAVIGEPTDMKACFKHFGYIEANLKAKGTRKHASLAKQKENAVHTMLSTLLKLTDHISKTKPEIICNIRDVFSKRSGFVVPDFCESWIDLHIPPEYSAGDIIFELEEYLRNLFPDVKNIEEILDITTIHSGYSIPEKSPFANSLRSSFQKCGLDWNTSFFPSDSDAVFFWENGIKPVILGPGTLEKAHCEDESVSFSQVIDAAKVYLEILKTC